MRKNGNYIAPQTAINHVHGLLQLMSVMTKDNRYEGAYSPDMERRQTTMCEVLDRVENRGIQKGENAIISLISYLLLNNRNEDIKRITEEVAYRNKLLAEMSENKI